MKHPSPFLVTRKPIELQMTPMIDCVFLLLVYFLWSSSFITPEFILPGQLSAQPASAAGISADEPPTPEADFVDVVVRLRGNAEQVSWQLNDVEVTSLKQLQENLARIAAIKKDAPVVLHPDEDVPLGNVIDAYDIARAVGFVKIQFATNVALP